MSTHETDAGPQVPPPPDLVHHPDLMRRWSVSRTTVYREIERGRLRRHMGGLVRFAIEDVANYERRSLST